MSYLEPSFYTPAATALAFYVTVFAVAEVCRKVVEKVFHPKNSVRIFLIEFIATTQMCACVYENGVMLKNYGIIGFSSTVASLLFMGGVYNRGAYVSPLLPIELLYRGKMTLGEYTPYMFGEILGGLSAFRVAVFLWLNTYEYLDEHRFALLMVKDCKLSYKVDFIFVVLFEMFGTALIRVAVSLMPNSKKPFLVPIFVAGMLSIALAFIGVPGLNPVVVSSRMFGCSGLDQQWFMALYWVCPVIGWLVGANVSDRLEARCAKKGGKKQESKPMKKTEEKKKAFPKTAKQKKDE